MASNENFDLMAFIDDSIKFTFLVVLQTKFRAECEEGIPTK